MNHALARFRQRVAKNLARTAQWEETTRTLPIGESRQAWVMRDDKFQVMVEPFEPNGQAAGYTVWATKYDDPSGVGRIVFRQTEDDLDQAKRVGEQIWADKAAYLMGIQGEGKTAEVKVYGDPEALYPTLERGGNSYSVWEAADGGGYAQCNFCGAAQSRVSDEFLELWMATTHPRECPNREEGRKMTWVMTGEPKWSSSRKTASTTDIEAIVRGMADAIVWTGTDDEGEPLDSQFDSSDLDQAAMSLLRKDAEDFVRQAGELLDQLPESYGGGEQVGHDLILTSQGQGAGFWDRGLGALGDQLSDVAKGLGYEFGKQVFPNSDVGGLSIDGSKKRAFGEGNDAGYSGVAAQAYENGRHDARSGYPSHPPGDEEARAAYLDGWDSVFKRPSLRPHPEARKTAAASAELVAQADAAYDREDRAWFSAQSVDDLLALWATITVDNWAGWDDEVYDALYSKGHRFSRKSRKTAGRASQELTDVFASVAKAVRDRYPTEGLAGLTQEEWDSILAAIQVEADAGSRQAELELANYANVNPKWIEPRSMLGLASRLGIDDVYTMIYGASRKQATDDYSWEGFPADVVKGRSSANYRAEEMAFDSGRPAYVYMLDGGEDMLVSLNPDLPSPTSGGVMERLSETQPPASLPWRHSKQAATMTVTPHEAREPGALAGFDVTCSECGYVGGSSMQTGAQDYVRGHMRVVHPDQKEGSKIATEWTPESAWALMGNDTTENIKKMIRALQMFPWENTQEDKNRLEAAQYIVKNKVKNPRYSSFQSALVRAAEHVLALDPQSGYGDSSLDDVEVTDDNADERAMWPWEISDEQRAADDAEYLRATDEMRKTMRLNVWGQNNTAFVIVAAECDVCGEPLDKRGESYHHQSGMADTSHRAIPRTGAKSDRADGWIVYYPTGGGPGAGLGTTQVQSAWYRDEADADAEVRRYPGSEKVPGWADLVEGWMKPHDTSYLYEGSRRAADQFYADASECSKCGAAISFDSDTNKWADEDNGSTTCAEGGKHSPTSPDEYPSEAFASKVAYFDPELPAGYQDADIEMRELADAAPTGINNCPNCGAVDSLINSFGNEVKDAQAKAIASNAGVSQWVACYDCQTVFNNQQGKFPEQLGKVSHFASNRDAVQEATCATCGDGIYVVGGGSDWHHYSDDRDYDGHAIEPLHGSTKRVSRKIAWKGLAIYPDKRVEDIEVNGIGDLQSVIGGLVEAVVFRDGSQMWLSETFLAEDDFNSIATDVAGLGGRVDLLMRGVTGAVIVSGPDDGQGATTDIGESGRRLVKRVSREAMNGRRMGHGGAGKTAQTYGTTSLCVDCGLDIVWRKIEGEEMWVTVGEFADGGQRAFCVTSEDALHHPSGGVTAKTAEWYDDVDKKDDDSDDEPKDSDEDEDSDEDTDSEESDDDAVESEDSAEEEVEKEDSDEGDDEDDEDEDKDSEKQALFRSVVQSNLKKMERK